MRSGIVLVLGTVALTATSALFLACADSAPPDLADVPSGIGNPHLRVVKSVRALPAPVLHLCADFNGAMADPGASWNAVDTGPADRPHRRLIWAVTDLTTYVVHFEVGGRSHYYATVAASTVTPTSTAIASEQSNHAITRVDDVVATVLRLAPQLRPN
jgi:hypothetical protein